MAELTCVPYDCTKDKEPPHLALAMPVSGVAVLGKDNNPLYIRAYGQHDHLRFHFIVHTALDFVEEKGAEHAL